MPNDETLEQLLVRVWDDPADPRGLARAVAERCAEIAEAEEELEDQPPEFMTASEVNVARATFHATKEIIAASIRAFAGADDAK